MIAEVFPKIGLRNKSNSKLLRIGLFLFGRYLASNLAELVN